MNASHKQPHQQTEKDKLNGKRLYSWKAFDYHPYQRGIGWYITFGLLTFGTALVVYINDPASSSVPVACICLVSAFYLWVHREGEFEQPITLYQKGIEVGDHKLIPWNNFKGYWFLEDDHSRLLVLESEKWDQDRVRILLGDSHSERISQAMDKIDLSHLTDKKENSFDLWSRVFRL
jgi:hypothetical protein